MESSTRAASYGKAAKFLGIDSQQRLEAAFAEYLQAQPDAGGVSPSKLTELWHQQLRDPGVAGSFVHALLQQIGVKNRTALAASLVRTLAYVVLFVPFTLSSRGETALKSWLQRLNEGQGSGGGSFESMTAALVQRRVSGSEEEVAQLSLLVTLLTSCDNALVLTAPDLHVSGVESVRSTGSFPFSLPYTMSSVAGGSFLEGTYDTLCGLALHLPAYSGPHPAFSLSSVAFALHMWRGVLSLHPIPDPAFLSECGGPLLAIAAAWPPPVCHQATQLLQQLCKEQLAPGSNALGALLREFPLLALPDAAEEAEAAGVWADSQRTATVVYRKFDQHWGLWDRLLDASKRGVPSCIAWDADLRQQVILTAFAMHTDASVPALRTAVQAALPAQAAKWCAAVLAVCLSVSPEPLAASRELGMVRGGTLQGVAPAGEGALASTPAEDGEGVTEVGALGRGVFANSAAADVLGRQAVPLQSCLEEHTRRVLALGALGRDILGDTCPPIASSPWMRLPSQGSSQAPTPPPLRLPSWFGVPDMRVTYSPVQLPADGLDDSALVMPVSTSLPRLPPAQVSSIQLQAAAGGASAPSWPCIVGHSAMVGMESQVQRVLKAARKARDVPPAFHTPQEWGGVGADLAPIASTPALRLVAAGDDAVVHTVVAALMAARCKDPGAFASLDVQIFVLPSPEVGKGNLLAEHLAFTDPWYRRFVFGPFRGDTDVLPSPNLHLAAAAMQPDPIGGLGPHTMHAQLLQEYLRRSHRRMQVAVWQVECWLPAASAGRSSRVAAMGSGGASRPGEAAGASQDIWVEGTGVHCPDRPPDLLIPMVAYLELGLHVTAAKAQAQAGGTWWGAVRAALQQGRPLGTEDIAVQMNCQSVQAEEGAAAPSPLHCRHQRFTTLRLSNVPAVRHSAAGVAAAGVSQAAQTAPSGHVAGPAGLGGDEVRSAAGGAVWAREAGSVVAPHSPWLEVSAVPNSCGVLPWLSGKAASMARSEAAAPPPSTLGEQLQDMCDAAARSAVANHVVIAPPGRVGSTTASGSGNMDIVVDGVLFPGQFSAIRVSPLVTEVGGGRSCLDVMHCS